MVKKQREKIEDYDCQCKKCNINSISYIWKKRHLYIYIYDWKITKKHT